MSEWKLTEDTTSYKVRTFMLKDTNYVVIPAWAINHLEMTPTELIIYSVIYGFSQDGESEFKGSAGYLCDITRTSRQTVMNCLKSLVEKKYIKKIEHFENGVSLPRYVDMVSKNFTGGCQISVHHNTSTDTSSSSKEVKENPQSKCGKAHGDDTTKNLSSDNHDSTSKKGAKSIEHPTLEQCITYAKSLQMVVDPYKFHRYFESMGWVDSRGRQVKNWRLKMKTWNSYAVSEGTGVAKNHQTSSDNEQVAQIAQARRRNEENDNGIF